MSIIYAFKVKCLFIFVPMLFREALFLWDVDQSTNANKQRIATVISHEFAHKWFGNLVTCEWWAYTWLNEGFARYFEYFTTGDVS